MASQEEMQRQANVDRVRDMMENFVPHTESWCAGLHDDIAMEFPFGADVGLPPRMEGKAVCAGLFQAVVDKLGLKFSNLRISPMADPNCVVVEYDGTGSFNGKPYNQKYIAVLQFADGKLILYREYVDSKIVENVIGHLSALMQ